MTAGEPERLGAEDYLALVLAGDRDTAIDHLLSRLYRGARFSDLVTSIITPAQHEVGRRWETNTLTVADEHAATSITEAAIAVVASEARRRLTAPRSDRAPRVVAACVEDEWHTLPVRMVAEALILDGLDVTFLGPSVPAAHLTSYLETARPDACVLGCAVMSHLPALRRCVDGAHTAGVPVLVGGRALGGLPERAEAVGADAWSDDASEAAAVMAQWTRRRPKLRHVRTRPGDAPGTFMEAALLERPPTDLVSAVVDDLLLRYPRLASFSTSDLDRTREDVEHIMRHAAAALAVADPIVFFDFTEWLLRILDARHVPLEAIVNGYSAIATVVRADMPNAALLVESALTLFS